MSGPAAYRAWQDRGTQKVLNGEFSDAFEDRFNDAHPLANAAKSFWGGIEYRFFNDGRRGVLVGQNGWLYTSEEFETPRNGGDVYQAHLDFIGQTAQILKNENITLHIVLIPAKARIYPQYLGEHQYPA